MGLLTDLTVLSSLPRLFSLAPDRPSWGGNVPNFHLQWRDNQTYGLDKTLSRTVHLWRRNNDRLVWKIALLPALLHTWVFTLGHCMFHQVYSALRCYSQATSFLDIWEGDMFVGCVSRCRWWLAAVFFRYCWNGERKRNVEWSNKEVQPCIIPGSLSSGRSSMDCAGNTSAIPPPNDVFLKERGWGSYSM